MGGFYIKDDHPMALRLAVRLHALVKATTGPEIDSLA